MKVSFITEYQGNFMPVDRISTFTLMWSKRTRRRQ